MVIRNAIRLSRPLQRFGALGYGAWRDKAQRHEVGATAQQRHDAVADGRSLRLLQQRSPTAQC